MPTFAFIGGIGPWEMGIVLVIVLILFGAGKLPQVFESFGKSMKAFRDAQKDDEPESEPKVLDDGGDPVADAHEVKEKAL
jgi:sec-independent protein translocase protein TatA